MSTATLLFSTQAYRDLAQRIAEHTAFEPGHLDTRQFPDGERYQRIVTSLDRRNVVLVGGTISDADTLELYDLACTLVEYGAMSLTLVIPYYGYSTMERAELPGEVVTAKSRARLLSAIPTASCGNRVLLVDLHSSGLPYYFEGGMRPVHLYAKPVILAAARRLGGKQFVLACTDAGRAKWVESLANDLGVTASFVFKRRIDDRRTEVAATSAHVQDQCVVIYDDMIRTGSSLIHAAQAYRDAGATSIAAIATHGLFPEDALDRLRATGLFTQIVCTDSHPRANALRDRQPDSFLVVDSIAELLAEHLLGESGS